MIPLSDLEVVDTQDLLKDMFSYLKTVPSFAFDFETRSVDFDKFPNGALDRTRMLPDLFSASTDTRAFVVPIGMLTVPVVSLQDFVDISKPVMEDPSIMHDGYNAAYDFHVFANQNVWVAGYRDWMVAAALLDDNRAKSLKERCKDVGMELHKYDFKKYWTMRDKILNPDRVFYTATGRVKKEVVYTLADIEPLEKEYISYSAEDSIATYFLGELYTELLEKEGLSNLFFRLRNPAVRTAFMMERRGIRIDVAGLAQRKKLAEIDLVKYEKDILSIAGKHFNIGSTKEVGRVLYDEMRLPVKKKTPKGAPSSDAETLGLLGQDGHEIAIALSKHRKVAKIMSSYLGPKSKFSSNVKPWEYIHPSFNTVGTKTGRWSSSDPNFMQLPRNTEANYTLREVIIPSAGKVLVGGDLCVAEGQRVRTDHGYIPIEEVTVGMFAIQEDGSLRTITHTIISGPKMVVDMKLVSGDVIRSTPEHKFRVINSERQYVFKRLKNIEPTDYVAISPKGLHEGENGFPTISGNTPLEALLGLHKIDSITEVGVLSTYDLTVEDTHTFICEGFVTHNSQAELRVMADLSQDPVMLEEYRKDTAFQQCIIDGNDPKELGLELSDIHQTTADACGCTRNVAKTINFGLIYRMAGSTLARSLNKALWDFKFSEGDYTWDPLNDTIDERLGTEFKEMYFIKYAGVKAYHRLVEQRLQDYGYVETRFGQKRRLPDIYANDNYLRWRAGTQSINATIQGHVGELMTLCMNRVHNDKVLKECGFRLILQVHDEILGECDPDCVDIVKQRLAQIFMRPMEPTKDRPYFGYRVPIIFEINSGMKWSDIH